jgi:hypothetical protein
MRVVRVTPVENFSKQQQELLLLLNFFPATPPIPSASYPQANPSILRARLAQWHRKLYLLLPPWPW